MEMKLKSDDWFKSYGQMKYPLGRSLEAAMLCILPSIKYVQINLWFLFGCISPGAKGLKWRFFDYESEQAEFGLRL